jgi:hypothetical protein
MGSSFRLLGVDVLRVVGDLCQDVRAPSVIGPLLDRAAMRGRVVRENASVRRARGGNYAAAGSQKPIFVRVIMLDI